MVDSLFLLAATDKPPLSFDLRFPLSILHFLEFAIWGAWFVVLGNYLNSLQFSRKDIGRIYATMSLGAVVSPMFIGTIADRYFATEQLLGVSHLLGAFLLFGMAQIKTPRAFYWVALVYAIVYTPTISLATSIIFAQEQVDASRDFPTIRVLGTIGWIVAGMSLRFFIPAGQSVNNRPLLLAGVLSLVLGVYSFFLPHTPPPASGAGAEASASLGVDRIAVTQGGQGYKQPPAVELEGPGTGAEFKVVIEDGKVVEVKVVDPGKGFAVPPKVTLKGGGGAGAAATASLRVVAVTVTQHGSGYQTSPTITFAGGGGKGAEGKATLNDKQGVQSVLVLKGGTDYTSPPSVNFPAAEVPFLRAITLLKDRSFAVFFGVSFLITLALAFYYSFTALFLEKGHNVQPENVGPLMTIGQWVEIIFMFTLPFFLAAFGMKWVLAIGMAAWALRYLIFATCGALPLILVGVGLHGICYDFFFGAGFIHVEQTAPAEIRASGQSLFAVLTYGLGMWLGTEAAGWLNQRFTKVQTDPQTGQTHTATDWSKFWLVPAIGALVSLALFVVLF